MLRIAVLDDYQNVALSLVDWGRLGADVEAVSFARHIDDVDEAARTLADFDVFVLMRERMNVPKALLERLPRLKYIVVTGSHTRSVDVAAARARGVPVSLTVSTVSVSAAEHTWALVMALARNIAIEDRNMREGRWMTEVGFRLEGRTLGVIGLGALGGKVAEYGRAFGMRVIAWSANLTTARAAECGASLVSKDELLKTADVITIHLKLSPRTQGVIGAAEFAMMKKTAVLVNTSRGPIVEETAMIAALTNGQILRAGLDVYDHEPLPADHPLRNIANTVLTPHIGFTVEEGLRGYYEDSIKLIAAWRAGTPLNVYEGFKA